MSAMTSSKKKKKKSKKLKGGRSGLAKGLSVYGTGAPRQAALQGGRDVIEEDDQPSLTSIAYHEAGHVLAAE